MSKKLYIAIDGPSASGKGTIAKLLGEKLDLPVLYTGNIYRAIASKAIENQQDPHEVLAMVKIARNLKLEDLNNPHLSQEKIGQYASMIAVYPELRAATYEFQRNFIDHAQGAVIEGRDIGTVVCPEADYKFYMQADVEVRAQRRCKQQHSHDYQMILAELKIRDARDLGREIAPLKPAADAIIIDSSKLSASETLKKLISYIQNP